MGSGRSGLGYWGMELDLEGFCDCAFEGQEGPCLDWRRIVTVNASASEGNHVCVGPTYSSSDTVKLDRLSTR